MQARGEILGIIGPNGAGKSTLFDMIAGATKADSGTVAFEGTPTSGKPQSSLAQLGIVKTFQTSRPIHLHDVLREHYDGGLRA